jgi:hypothetical protein
MANHLNAFEGIWQRRSYGFFGTLTMGPVVPMRHTAAFYKVVINTPGLQIKLLFKIFSNSNLLRWVRGLHASYVPGTW